MLKTIYDIDSKNKLQKCSFQCNLKYLIRPVFVAELSD